MGQKKLIRFEAIKTFPNVFEYPEGMKGNWSKHFNNNHPITLELACGRGEYTVGLSAMHPQKNFIGIDIKGNRMYIGAKKCLNENRNNAAFLRTQIALLNNYFDENEVDEIWITFPDPQLRLSKAKKRLTHPHFLRLYQQILKKGGSIHLKTDSPDLFYFTKMVTELYDLPIVDANEDVYATSNNQELIGIKTYYEGLDIAQSNKVFYLHFKLPLALSKDDSELTNIIKEKIQLNK